MRRLSVCFAVASASCMAPGGDDFPPPRLAAVVPIAGSPGQPVMLLGDHFCAGPDDHDDTEPFVCAEPAGSVRFGTEHAESLAWTMTTIDVTVPLEALPGRTSVRVSVAGRTSNAVGFTVEVPGDPEPLANRDTP
jgi:hypothetical protein